MVHVPQPFRVSDYPLEFTPTGNKHICVAVPGFMKFFPSGPGRLSGENYIKKNVEDKPVLAVVFNKIKKLQSRPDVIRDYSGSTLQRVEITNYVNGRCRINVHGCCCTW